MNIFEVSNYKEIVLKILKARPNGGYGEFKCLAEHLRLGSVVISQIFKGARDLNEDQALQVCEYLNFTALETDYFLLLVQLERAGTHKLKTRIKQKIKEIVAKSQDLKSRLTQDVVLDLNASSTFYSNWFYCGLNLATSIKGYNDIESLAERFSLPRNLVKEVVDFLIKYGLCIEKSGKLDMGPSVTHLEAGSPLVSRHHTNWRLKGIEQMSSIDEGEIFYTGPCALSRDAVAEIRKKIVLLIEDFTKVASQSESQVLGCLNIDWFQY